MHVYYPFICLTGSASSGMHLPRRLLSSVQTCDCWMLHASSAPCCSQPWLVCHEPQEHAFDLTNPIDAPSTKPQERSHHRQHAWLRTRAQRQYESDVKGRGPSHNGLVTEQSQETTKKLQEQLPYLTLPGGFWTVSRKRMRLHACRITISKGGPVFLSRDGYDLPLAMRKP